MATEEILTLPSDYPWEPTSGVDVFLNLDEVVQTEFGAVLNPPTSPLFGFESSDDSGLSPPHSNEHSSNTSSPFHPGFASFPSSPLRNDDMFVGSTYSSYLSLDPAVLAAPDPEVKEESPQPAKNKAKNRKRQRKEEKTDAQQVEVTALTLSKDMLLKISSADLEAFFRKFSSVRPLTDAEEREIKRQRRLVKNRESALASRERKKSLMNDFEAANKKLSEDNQLLHQHNTQLRAENEALRIENGQLRDLLQAEGKSGLLGQLGQLATIGRPRTAPGVSTEKVRNAGAVLLIVMLSFGLVLNSNNSPFNKKLSDSEGVSREPAMSALVRRGDASMMMPRSSVQRVLLEVGPERIDQRNDSLFSKLPPSNGETLALPLSADEPPRVEVKLEPLPMEVDLPVASAPKLIPRIEPTVVRSGTAAHSGRQAAAARQAATPIKMRVQDEPDDDDDDEVARTRWQAKSRPQSAFMSGFINSSTPVISVDQDADLNSWSSNRTRAPARPNTAYVTCPSGLRQVIPADTDPLDPDAPFYISMLIPTRSSGVKAKANFLSNSSNNDAEQPPDVENEEGMLEITCQVVDIQLIPFRNVPAALVA